MSPLQGFPWGLANADPAGTARAQHGHGAGACGRRAQSQPVQLAGRRSASARLFPAEIKMHLVTSCPLVHKTHQQHLRRGRDFPLLSYVRGLLLLQCTGGLRFMKTYHLFYISNHTSKSFLSILVLLVYFCNRKAQNRDAVSLYVKLIEVFISLSEISLSGILFLHYHLL